MNAIVRAARRNVVMIAALAVLGAAVAALAAMAATPVYSSTARVYVSVGAAGSSAAELAQARSYGAQVIASYAEVATTDVVLGPALERAGIYLDAGAARAKVSAATATDSLMLELTATAADPITAAALANAVAASFETVVEDELEARTSPGATTVRVVTAQPALVPTQPASPDPPLWVALGTLAGAAAGVAVAVARTALDTRLRSADEIAEVVDAPRLGEIVHSTDAARFPAMVAARPHSAAAEGFRALRTNVSFLPAEGGGRTVAVTSAIPGEGKSTVAANLASAVAETGMRVALVDADLRKPTVADRFGIEGGVGLSDVLAGRLPLSEAMQPWGETPLFLLPAGALPPNPAELLGSHAMGLVADELRAVFDVVVFDAPPLLAVTDAAVLARGLTGALLVVRTTHARRAQVADAIASLAAADARLLGVVVNGMPSTGVAGTAYGAYYGRSTPVDAAR